MAGKPRQDDSLAMALARGVSVAQAARDAGISERTIYRRLADPTFRARVQAARDDLLGQTTGRLAGAAQAAVDRLVKLLDSKRPSVQLGAARAILAALCRYRESHDFSARLAALEAAIQPKTPQEP